MVFVQCMVATGLFTGILVADNGTMWVVAGLEQTKRINGNQCLITPESELEPGMVIDLKNTGIRTPETVGIYAEVIGKLDQVASRVAK